jgi:hypothetical protein
MEKVNITLEKDQFAVFTVNGRNVFITHKMLNHISWFQNGYYDEKMVNKGIEEEIKSSSVIYDTILNLADPTTEYTSDEIMDTLHRVRYLRENIQKLGIPKEISSQPDFKL